MTRFFQRLLHLQRGDFGRGAPLFLYLMLVISSYQMAKSVRDSLFLSVYKPEKISYAITAIAVAVTFVFAAYVTIGRRISVRNLLIGSGGVFIAGFAAFWYGAHYRPDLGWQFFALYVWVGIYGVLAPAQVWTLANFVLTTREAKRVFGLVAGGAITGFIMGGALTNQLAERIGTEGLLLVIAVHIFFCALLVYFIWRSRTTAGAENDWAETAAREESPQSLAEGMKAILSSRYVVAIAAVICISSLVTTFAGWQWVVIAKQAYPEKNKLTAFFGQFNFWVAMACLATQMLLTSRLLRRFGIGPALFVVPVALLAGEIGVLALLGSLTAGMMLKGSDQLLRYSIDKSSVELLYLPIPQSVKLQAKSFIDTVVWRVGDSLAGVVLAIFTDQLKWSVVKVSWVNIVFIGGWLLAAFFARREYVVTLRESILQHRLDAERASAPVLDRSTTDILAAGLQATDPQEILYALDLFNMGQQRAAHPAVRDLLTHPAAPVRQRAIAILAAANDTSVAPQIEKMLSDPELDVRTEALLYLTHHVHIDPLGRIQELGDFSDYSIRSAMVAFLARPGSTQNLEAAHVLLDTMVREPGAEGQRTRLEAARLLSSLPDKFDDALRVLLMDSDAEVARAAIRAVGKLNKRIFVIRILDRLGEPALAPEIMDAVGSLGDRVVGTLRDHLGDAAVPIAVRREIPPVLVRVGSAAAARALEEHLLEADAILRFRVISALNKLRRDNPEIPVDEQMVETVLAAEIMGHYRSYQILGTLGGSLESDDPVVRALKETLDQEVERIFRLLGLSFPKHDLHSAYFGLQSRDTVVHANALEFLDNILKPQLRNMLVPLLDSDVSVPERVRLANRIVGTPVQTQEEAVAALVASDDPWLKSCGAYAIGSLRLQSLAFELEACLNHPDALLRETARQARRRLGLAGAV
jgi:AAA family ATP:ADP antiporter